MPSEQRLVRHSVSRGQAAQPCALWQCVRSIATADDCLRRNASASPATPPRMVPHPHRPALAHRSHVRRNNQTADNRVRELHDTGGARNAACGCRPNPAHAGWSPPRGAASSLNVHTQRRRGDEGEKSVTVQRPRFRGILLESSVNPIMVARAAGCDLRGWDSNTRRYLASHRYRGTSKGLRQRHRYHRAMDLAPVDAINKPRHNKQGYSPQNARQCQKRPASTPQRGKFGV